MFTLPKTNKLPHFKYLIFYFNTQIRNKRAPKKLTEAEVFNYVGISRQTYYRLLSSPINSAESTDVEILVKFAQFYATQLKQDINVSHMIHPDAAKLITQKLRA